MVRWAAAGPSGWRNRAPPMQMRAGVDTMRAAAIALVLAGMTTAAWAQVGELTDRTKLRVCADPSNLPFSNKAGEGFENKIAELLASKLGVPLTYTWYPQSTGFVRNTLNAGVCDVVIGIPTPSQLMQNTNPYFRSSYALVQRADANPKITSLHDPALADLKIGAVAGTPPVTLLAQQGLLAHLKPYQLVVDTRFDSPGRQMVEDVAAKVIDVAIAWGPIAGYWARQQKEPIEVTPLVGEEAGLHLDFRMSMGLRRGEPDWKRTLNEFLAANGDAIQAILLDYGIPLIDAQGQPIPARAEKQGRLEAVPEPAGYRLADYRAPVPAALAGARVVTTAQLQALIGAAAPPLLIDVLPAPRPPANRPPGSIWRPAPRADIPGSVWLPNVGYGELPGEFEGWFRDNLARLTEGDRSRQMIFYCQANCWMSWNAAKRALAYGYANIVWYPEGTDGWRAAGLPLVAAEPVPMPDFLPSPARSATALERSSRAG
jgi:quinoprotein dehydrogenase-associated probable ABC transporter substrate-binding protein/PQQ-dependent catabolism-associated CXXCW motif protein